MNESERPRVIAGFGRSGTTWVQDVLAESNRLRPVFEPLNPILGRETATYAHRFLGPQDSEQELYRLLYPFFFGDFRSLWVDYRIVRRLLWPKSRDFTSWHHLRGRLRFISDARDNIVRYHPQRRHRERIVKFVRANMMLPWLVENFQARIVFVVRHPAAVVMSQMRAPKAWNWNERIDIYRNDKRLQAVLEDRTKEMLFMPLEMLEALTLSWCIENSVAMGQAATYGIHVVYYERLLEDADLEWRRILSALDLQVMPGENLIGRPSQQAWGDKARDARLVRDYGSWMSVVDNDTVSRIQAVLDATGMSMYTVTDALPAAASYSRQV